MKKKEVIGREFGESVYERKTVSERESEHRTEDIITFWIQG